MVRNLSELFPLGKPVIGMIHLAGSNPNEKLNRALEEMAIFEEEGVAGAIVENYHGTQADIERLFNHMREQKRGTRLVLGVNLLSNPCYGLKLVRKYQIIKFVQFDNLQDNFHDLPEYLAMRALAEYKNIPVFGGIRFKYTASTGKTLKRDVRDGMSRCEAIVTTGEGAGIETPIDKLKEFKKIMGDYPLIVGAGVTATNVYDQLSIADGAIVGSYFKNGNTENPVDKERVRELASQHPDLRKRVPIYF